MLLKGTLDWETCILLAFLSEGNNFYGHQSKPRSEAALYYSFLNDFFVFLRCYYIKEAFMRIKRLLIFLHIQVIGI
jgi:hypothetical protein